MIAIASSVLAALTVLVAVWMAASLRLMHAEDHKYTDVWGTFVTTAWVATIATIVLSVALILHNPPQAPWEHPLVWIQFLTLMIGVLVAGAGHNTITYYVRRKTRAPLLREMSSPTSRHS